MSMDAGFLFDTVAEYDAEIAIVRNTIRRISRLGAHTKNVNENTERTNTEMTLGQARSYLRQLIDERSALKSTLNGRVIGCAW